MWKAFWVYIDWKVSGKQQQAEGKCVKTNICTWTTMIKEIQSQDKNSLDKLYIPT